MQKYTNKYHMYITIHSLCHATQISSGASCFHWSSLRCFYNFIRVHLWSIQSIDLERHIFAYVRPHSWQCMSEHKPSHEAQGIAVDLWDRIVSRHRSGEGGTEKCLQHWRSQWAQWPPSSVNWSLKPPGLGIRIDKILTIPIPYWFLLIDLIPYRFSYLLYSYAS